MAQYKCSRYVWSAEGWSTRTMQQLASEYSSCVWFESSKRAMLQCDWYGMTPTKEEWNEG